MLRQKEQSMRDPNAVIATDELGALLGRGEVRIYDGTTFSNPPPPGVDQPYIPVPELATFREAHIPGADFLDLRGEFSDNSQRHWFMMPKDVAQLETAFARHGIGAGIPNGVCPGAGGRRGDPVKPGAVRGTKDRQPDHERTDRIRPGGLAAFRQ
jgi:hypothetical protein